MLSFPIKFRRRRRLPSAGASAGPAALAVIAIVNVNYDEPLLSFTAVFNTTEDVPLVVPEGGFDPLKWNVRYQLVRFGGYDAQITAYNAIIVTVSPTEGDAGADEVNYTNAPSDIADTLGRELGAFSMGM